MFLGLTSLSKTKLKNTGLQLLFELMLFLMKSQGVLSKLKKDISTMTDQPIFTTI